VNKHLTWLIERHPALECCADDIARAFEIMRDSFRAGGKTLFCGNGGSAADAEHWCAELMKGFEKKRPLDAALKSRLPGDVADVLQGALPAIPLTGFISLSTAFANDVRGDLIFAQMVLGLGRPGDVLVGISTSGNSKNVCHALEVAKARDLKTIGLTGRGGGRVVELSDVAISVPAIRTCEVQEYHLPVYHCISLMLEDEFFA
jgi:D-sedoheptulose 7-phosphate isomerase